MEKEDLDVEENEENVEKEDNGETVEGGEEKRVVKKSRGPDNQTLLRLLEQGEQLHSMFRCARIQVIEGKK